MMRPEEAAKSEDEKSTTLRRQWTSPDDGWGTHNIPSDLQKMPMGHLEKSNLRWVRFGGLSRFGGCI